MNIPNQDLVQYLIQREEQRIRTRVADVVSNADDLQQVCSQRLVSRSYVSSIRSCLDDIEVSLTRIDALRDVQEKP